MVDANVAIERHRSANAVTIQNLHDPDDADPVSIVANGPGWDVGYLAGTKTAGRSRSENDSMAGGNIGTEMALRAAPDGYTLLLIQAGNVINTSLYSNLSFNFPRDAAPSDGSPMASRRD